MNLKPYTRTLHFQRDPKIVHYLKTSMSLILLFLTIAWADTTYLHTKFNYVAERSPLVFIQQKEFQSFSRIARSPIMRYSKDRAWKSVVPKISTIYIRSSYDTTLQPSLFYNSGSPNKKPLLLVLHSWSADYKQHFSIPYGIWAKNNDWVFIHPNYRGAFTNSNATASDASIQDILDAINYAKKNANIDHDRIYITGFSGGAMVTLIMLGKHPELFTAAAVWVPVYDLEQWYHTTKFAKHNYSNHISNSCGAAPLEKTNALSECKKRSPSTYLKKIKDKKIKLFIATGVRDLFVPPGHSLEVFNDLAHKKDSFSPEEIAYINKHLKLPNYLSGGTFVDTLFNGSGYKLLYQRSSENIQLNIFDGNHDVFYNVGLYWLSLQNRASLD